MYALVSVDFLRPLVQQVLPASTASGTQHTPQSSAASPALFGLMYQLLEVLALRHRLLITLAVGGEFVQRAWFSFLKVPISGSAAVLVWADYMLQVNKLLQDDHHAVSHAALLLPNCQPYRQQTDTPLNCRHCVEWKAAMHPTPHPGHSLYSPHCT